MYAFTRNGENNMSFLTENYVEILAVAGALITVATFITTLTPTKKDDAVVSKIRATLEFISLRLGK